MFISNIIWRKHTFSLTYGNNSTTVLSIYSKHLQAWWPKVLVLQGILLLLISLRPEEKKEMVPWCNKRYISSQRIPRQLPCSNNPPTCVDGQHRGWCGRFRVRRIWFDEWWYNDGWWKWRHCSKSCAQIEINHNGGHFLARQWRPWQDQRKGFKKRNRHWTQ